jgi:Secretion system C-terminal sorting domain
MKKYYSTLLALLLTISMFAQWVQVGNTFVGDVNQDDFGSDVDMSNDGNRVVVSASLSIFSNEDIPYTKIYQNHNGAWEQLGSNIVESNINFGDGFDVRVSISGEGNRVIIGNSRHLDSNGRVRMYEYDGSNWIQLGSDITGQEFAEFGNSIALNNIGNRFVVGERKFNFSEGRVRVYELNGNNLVQLGQSLLGSNNEFLGREVAINGDGTKIATVSSNGGMTKIFELNGNTWEQVGSTLSIGNQGSSSEVALNGDGNLVVICNPSENINGTFSGACKVYSFINNDWEQLGSDIIGDGENYALGIDLDLNQAGDILGVSSTEGTQSSGFIRVFQFNNGSWDVIDEDINGTQVTYLYKAAVALNSSGNRIVTSSLIDSGYVEVYENQNILQVNEFDSSNIKIFPNPATATVNINGLKDLQVSRITLTDVLGRTVLERKETVNANISISVNNLTAGLYFVNIETEQGTIVKQLMVE